MARGDDMTLLERLAGTPPPSPPSAVPAEPPAAVVPTHGNIRLVPYNAIYDPQADAFLAYMWQRLQRDDVVDYYFPGQKETGFATFVRMMSGDAQVALVITDATNGQWKDTVAGFVTWTPSHMGASEVIIAGFIFFREFWDHRTTDNTGAAAFDYWFTQTKAQVVLGVCPALHMTALRYNKRIGLHEVGRIPQAHLYHGEPCDAVLVAITRNEWLARKGGN